MLYAISDRRKSPGGIVEWARALLNAGIEMLQIREKDLPAGELYRLTRAVLELPNPLGTKVLVNSRVDVALAAGAHGVHLPSNAPAASDVRRVTPTGFRIGVSCHTVEEVRRAEPEGADFAVFGPVFEPLSKFSEFEPAGLEALGRACRSARISVLALGGVDSANARLCEEQGAAGVAGISLFLGSRPTGGALYRLLLGR